MEFKKQAQIRTQPLASPARLGVVLERATLEALKIEALRRDTTASEIVRALIDDFLRRSEKGE